MPAQMPESGVFAIPGSRNCPSSCACRATGCAPLSQQTRHCPSAFLARRRVGFLPAADTVESSFSDLGDMFFVCDTLKMQYVRLVDAPLYDAGYALWSAGFDTEARFAAEETLKVVRRFATVLVDSPTLAYLLRSRLFEQGLTHNTEILHISEFLAPHADRLPVVRTRSAAYYHDPCYLGRKLGIYEAPRRLIARCVESPREFFHSRELAECCGGGNSVAQSFPEVAAAQARRRLEEPVLFGVQTVVTACPTCKRTLADARGGVDVLSLIGLLAWSLRQPDKLPSHQDPEA
jgi:Fe-S oxidoreductase